MRRQRRWGVAGRLVALTAVVTLGGCDSITGERSSLPDGTYRLRLSSPDIVNIFVTPSWMRTPVAVDLTRSGDEVHITDSAGDVSHGLVQRFESRGEGWLLEFALDGREDGFHYWSVEITDGSCAVPVAVDADLPVTPEGLTVDFALCTIAPL